MKLNLVSLFQSTTSSRRRSCCRKKNNLSLVSPRKKLQWDCVSPFSNRTHLPRRGRAMADVISCLSTRIIASAGIQRFPNA
ncbi:unnamed protein product [Larinioides sclopetarius]|uniref:Uncharacterized protein n=1 Tax=Larinioides sclopetarius TaxID=280406 RepID=A0AAV1Z4L6_9ARAC